MTKYYSAGKRLFTLSFARWREKSIRGRYIRYYLKPAEDSRNWLARNVDFYGPLTVFLLATYAFVAGYTGSFWSAIILGGPLMAVEIFIAFRLRKIYMKKTVDHQRLWLAGRKCRENIGRISSPEDFFRLVTELFGKVPGLTDVHTVKDQNEKENSAARIAVRALRHGIPVAIGCLIPEVDKDITAEKIVQFKEEMKRLDIKEGILVAAGGFSLEARRAAQEGKNKVTLVDLYKLVEMARLAGHPVFPAVAVPDNGTGKDAMLYKSLIRHVFVREKAKSYFFAGGIILFLYFILPVASFFGNAYLLFGIVNLGLSLYCLLSNRETDILYPAAEKNE